jgi:hypothetical protein
MHSELVAQDHAQEAIVNRQRGVLRVIDKTLRSEPVHEITDPRPGGADHLGQVFLIDSGMDRFGSAFPAKMRQQQENPGQALLDGVEKLVDQILFKSNVAGKQVREEQFRDAVLLVEQTRHQRLLDPVNSAIAHGDSGREAQRLAGQASFAEELVVAQNADDRFLALVGCHRELHLALVEIPDGIRRVSLHEDRAARAVFYNGFPARDFCEECWPIDGLSLPVCSSKFRLALVAGSDNLKLALLWRHNFSLFKACLPGPWSWLAVERKGSASGPLGVTFSWTSA